MVGNESANTIGGKGFSHSRCLLTRFQAGDGHDKAPKIGGTPAADHEIRPGMWLGLNPARLSSDLHAVMHPTNRRSGQATYSAVYSKPATLPGNVHRANRKPRCGGNRPSGWMLSVQILGARTLLKYRSRIFWFDGAVT